MVSPNNNDPGEKKKQSVVGDVGYGEFDDHSSHDRTFVDKSSKDTIVDDHSYRHDHKDDHSRRSEKRIDRSKRKQVTKTTKIGDTVLEGSTQIKNVGTKAGYIVFLSVVAIIAIVAVVYILQKPSSVTSDQISQPVTKQGSPPKTATPIPEKKAVDSAQNVQPEPERVDAPKDRKQELKKQISEDVQVARSEPEEILPPKATLQETEKQAEKDIHAIHVPSKQVTQPKAVLEGSKPQEGKSTQTAQLQSQEMLTSKAMKTEPWPVADAKKEEWNHNWKLSLDVGFFFEGQEGKPYPMKNGMKLLANDNYAVYFKPKQECHVYIIQQDAKGELYCLFPNPEYGTGTNPVNSEYEYWVPSRDTWFFLDNFKGKEWIYFIATKTQYGKINQFIDDIKERRTNLPAFSKIITKMGPAGVRKSTFETVTVPGKNTMDLIIEKTLSDSESFIYSIWFNHQ